jgi:hypothetical protein
MTLEPVTQLQDRLITELRTETALAHDSISELAADRATWMARAEKAEAEEERLTREYRTEQADNRQMAQVNADLQRELDEARGALRGVGIRQIDGTYCYCGRVATHAAYCVAARAALTEKESK